MCLKHRPPGERRPVGLRVVPHNTLCTSCPMAFVLALARLRVRSRCERILRHRSCGRLEFPPPSLTKVLWCSITRPRPNRGVAVHGAFRHHSACNCGRHIKGLSEPPAGNGKSTKRSDNEIQPLRRMPLNRWRGYTADGTQGEA